MKQERMEEYLGAVYRLRKDTATPVPLSELAGYFDFSPVSIHEMVRKLVASGLLIYHRYHGVTLTDSGEAAAVKLMRRHRLWEKFLTDTLGIPWPDAHEVAGRLEHVATGLVTRRLAAFLGDSAACAELGIETEARSATPEMNLCSLPSGERAAVVRIAPEIPSRLQRLNRIGVVPGHSVSVVSQMPSGTMVSVDDEPGPVLVKAADASCVWLEAASTDVGVDLAMEA